MDEIYTVAYCVAFDYSETHFVFVFFFFASGGDGSVGVAMEENWRILAN
jgi:hypothetical protein